MAFLTSSCRKAIYPSPETWCWICTAYLHLDLNLSCYFSSCSIKSPYYRCSVLYVGSINRQSHQGRQWHNIERRSIVDQNLRESAVFHLGCDVQCFCAFAAIWWDFIIIEGDSYPSLCFPPSDLSCLLGHYVAHKPVSKRRIFKRTNFNKMLNTNKILNTNTTLNYIIKY